MAQSPVFTGSNSLDDDERFLSEVLSGTKPNAQISEVQQNSEVHPVLAELQADVNRDRLVLLEQQEEEALACGDFDEAERLKHEIRSLKTHTPLVPASCVPAVYYAKDPSPFEVGDVVRIVVENEPEAEDVKRRGTKNRVGEIVEDDGSDQPYLIRFPDGCEAWYKPEWITSQKAAAAAQAAQSQQIASTPFHPSASSSCTGSGPCESEESNEEIERLPEVPQDCIQLIINGSQKEERAQIFDRAGAYPGAVGLYREASSMLAEALHMMPMSHPDSPVIEQHIQEVHARANYLQSLGVQPAEIPLEEMIHGRQLKMGACSRGLDTAMSAGAVIGVAGLAIQGPLVGLVLAAGAAYATTRHDNIGKAARTVGDVGLQAADQTRALNEKYKWHQKIDQKLQISETAAVVDEKLHISHFGNQAGATARSVNERFSITEKTCAVANETSALVKSVDEKLGISSTSKAAIGKTGQAMSDFNERHQVSSKLSHGVTEATSRLTSWMTKKLTASMTSTSSESPPVISKDDI